MSEPDVVVAEIDKAVGWGLLRMKWLEQLKKIRELPETADGEADDR